jgi:hypothetical protein
LTNSEICSKPDDKRDKPEAATTTTVTTINRPVICEDDQYLCNDGQCIPRNLICDGSYNCLDGSDENQGKNVCV